jgi:hypothetical protein
VEKMTIKKSLPGKQGITIKIVLSKDSTPVSLALVLSRSGSKDASQPPFAGALLTEGIF